MKDIYKDRVANNIDSCIIKADVVRGMVTGERPADPKQADTYLREVIKALGEIQETISRG